MKGFNNHYLPSLRALEREEHTKSRTKEKKFLKSARAETILPFERDPEFWKEHLYSQHENVIRQEREDSKLARELNEEEYSKTGQLIECGCCFGEYAFDDMAQCPDGHLACGDCFRKGAETVLGEGKTALRCYTNGCNFCFAPSQLAKFLPKKTLEYFQKRQQEEEINQVDIPGLEKCPFCPYAVIIENQDDKVFHCLNCKKDTCRLCKEESHIPLRCNEVEKKQKRDMRLYLEQQMTEALCRTCNNPRCKKVFFKEEGCNHMKCTCGWEMCYVCRKTIKGYGHFKEGGCILHDDTKKRNRDDVKTAEKAAKQSYLEEHPELLVSEDANKNNNNNNENKRGRKKAKQTDPIVIS